MAEVKLNEQVNPKLEQGTEGISKPFVNIESSLSKIEGGFNIIKAILPDAENLDFKNKAQRNIFLSEQRFADKRKRLASDLKKWINLLSTDKKTPSEFVELCNQEEEKYTKLFKKNLGYALEATQNLEREYRTLDIFFKNTGSDRLADVRIINVNKNDLRDSQSDSSLAVVDLLEQAYNRLSLKNNYGLLIMPGYVLTEPSILKPWAEKARKYRLMLISDHADETLYDDLVKNTENYRGSDPHLKNVILAANWLLGRKKEEIANEEDHFYIPPSAALAGMIYNNNNKNISQPAANKIYGTVNEIAGVRLDLLRTEIETLMEKQVIPMVFSEGRVMAFNDTTLCESSDKAKESYAITRVFDWVGKVMINFLTDEALANWDTITSPPILKSKIQEFLNAQKKARLFQDYTIKDPKQDIDTKEITVDMEITPYFTAKNFNVKLSASQGDNGFNKDCEVQ